MKFEFGSILWVLLVTGSLADSIFKYKYFSTEKSCEGKCESHYVPRDECQCNTICKKFGDCCPDYDELCATDSVSDADLKAFSEKLIDLDVNNVADLVIIDPQTKTTKCSKEDKAPNPLFEGIDESVWEKPTVSLLVKLFDNYETDVSIPEDQTEEENKEVDDFLNGVLKTTIMNETLRFYNEKKIFVGDLMAFKNKLKELWFDLYDRSNALSTSGFEHVFIGELKTSDVGGFHSFYHFLKEEKAGNINYLGKLDEANFGELGTGITGVYTWNGRLKCIGSLTVGTSPEMDLAMYTTCILTRPGTKCNLSLKGQTVKIQTYVKKVGSKIHVATAYPDWS